MSAPRWVVALVRAVAAHGQADDVIGDLAEMHARRRARRGRRVADLLTALDAIDMALAVLRRRATRRIRGAGGSSAADPGGGSGGESGGWSGGGSGGWSGGGSGGWSGGGSGGRSDGGSGGRSDGGSGGSSPGRGVRDILGDWGRDLGQSGRTLSRAPGFATVAVATLGLAIGANTAIFSVVDTVLIDPLDYPASDRLVAIFSSAPGSEIPGELGPAPEFYLQYRSSKLLEEVAIWRDGQATARWEDRTEQLSIAYATPPLYAALGVTPALGRLPDERDTPGSVVLISHRFWATWFGADPAALGRSLEIAGARRTVIGVLEPRFRFPSERISAWVHAAVGEEAEFRPGFFTAGFLLGRVRPGTGRAALEAELGVLASRLRDPAAEPTQYGGFIERHRPVVRTLEDELVGDVAGPLWLLLGTVGIVLLIACANVANLFSVRAESRRHDFDVRQALGAGRIRLVRTQMTEAILLATAGGAAGALLAWVGLPILVRVAPENIPNLGDARLDAAALLFTLCVSLAAALFFGLVPSIRASRLRNVGAMRHRGGIGRSGRRWGRDALVMVQTASALVLLVGAGLLLRSFWTLTRVDPGYDTRGIFTFQIAPDREGVDDGPSLARFHEGFMERIAALPGVESVGLTMVLPLDEGAGTGRYFTERHIATGERPAPLRMTFVGGEYFRTMGIALRAGRVLDRSDQRVGAGTAVVGEAAAERLWPGEDPIGQRLYLSEDATEWAAVVGVVEDILVSDFRQDAPEPMVYLPMVGSTPDAWAVRSPAYVVRTPRTGGIAPDVRALIREHVPESPMYRVFTMEGLAQRSMAQLSFTMLLLAIASGLALVLGAVGLYGVLAYVVSTRDREIAVRMALGARRRAVRRMVVIQGARIAAAGVGAGLVAAVFLVRVLDSLLFGVGSLDAPTFAGMSAVMVSVALLASYLPARRASAVDPMESLRAE